MLRVVTVSSPERPFQRQLAAQVAGYLSDGMVVDITLVEPGEARALVEELAGLCAAHINPAVRSYAQLLITESRCIFNWGSEGEDRALLIDLDSYPLTRDLAGIVRSISDQMRRPGEHLLLSIVPALRRTSTYPRFFHRESHQSLEQQVNEGSCPSMYRLTCDVGLENSSDVVNVNLVPRRALLSPDGGILPRYRHLFQQQPLRISKDCREEISSPQPEVTEETLPFPGTAYDLRPGHALLWFDELFFHAPYLRAGRSLDELKANPRSIVIVNEFHNNSFQRLEWSPAVAKLLTDIL